MLIISLTTMKPVPGAQVELRSSTNQVVGKGITDATGAYTQDISGLKPTEPVAVITASKDGDFSYLALALSLIHI